MGIIMTLSMSTVACGKKEEKTEISKVAVEVENPTTGELTNDTTYIGTIEPQQQVYVTPKVSGTVTAAYFEVGDTVKEGDVLFKIDDEAAQLQMKSAEASYSQAEAGVTAATSGSRDLQNYQTEEQIRQLKEKLSDADDSIDDMEDDLDKLREQKGTASKQVTTTQATVDQLTEALGVQKNALADAQKAYDDAQTALTTASETKTDEDGNEIVPDETALKSLKDAVDSTKKNLELAQSKENELTSQLAIAKQGLSTAQAALNSIESGKTQLKSGIEQLKDGKDTIQDNLNTAEQTYSITQNEVYPETDATYAAQLQAASVGVDSAKMQLDFYTVKAPISGVVEAANVKKEDMAAAGNPAYIISNKDSMTVTFNATEKAKNTMNVGDHVTVERNGETFDGTITEIGTMAGQQTKLFQVKATIPGAGDKLPNGVSVKVSVTTEKEDGSTLVPFDALYFSGGDAYVYCVVDNKLVRTSVTVGLMDDDHAIIEDGLDADSLVVSNWSSKLRNGADAEIVSLNGESVASPEQEEDAAKEEATEDTPADAAAENEKTDNSASDEEAAE